MQKMQNFHVDVLYKESMKKHTTFKVGGEAEAFVIPHNIESLLLLLQELSKNNKDFFILGGGSNIVVSDLGIGIVVSTEKLDAIELFLEDKDSIRLRCFAGCSIETITNFCIEHELTGFERFAGLPGTIGGALYMNARCYDISISDILIQAQYISYSNIEKSLLYTMNKADWDYKVSPFQKNCCILFGDFILKKGVKSAIQEECTKYIEDRRSKGHFSHPSAGSVFKNNRDFGQPSGKIIDTVGLKGYKIGGAQIAPWHGNLIINLGDASADNIKEVVEHTQKYVQQKTGKKLECEILFVGKFI